MNDVRHALREEPVEARQGHCAKHRQRHEHVGVPETVGIEEHYGNEPEQEARQQVVLAFLEVAVHETRQRYGPYQYVHGDARPAAAIESERLVMHKDVYAPWQPQQVRPRQHFDDLLEHLAPVDGVEEKAEGDEMPQREVAVQRQGEKHSGRDFLVPVDGHEDKWREYQDERSSALDGGVPEQKIDR